MIRAWLVLVALAGRLASGAAPAYSSDSITNVNFTPGPFAPNSIITIFGSDLSFGTATLPAGTLTALPLELANVRVMVNNSAAPLLYVSPTQINLLVPSDLKPAGVNVYVVRQGVRGPDAAIALVPAAPQLFTGADGCAVAQHADYTTITAESPARPGETIIVYAAGLGATQPKTAPGEIPKYPGPIDVSLNILLDGTAISQDLIQYAGLAPGLAGVYQINLRLPDSVGTNPEIRAATGGQISAPGVKLAVQPQPSSD